MQLDCSGTVTFDIEFKGRSAEVIALVSSTLTEEVLLSWQILKKLGIIPDDFPEPEARAAVLTASSESNIKAISNGKEAREAVTQLIEEFGSVFDEEGPLRTMKGDPMRIHMKKNVTTTPLHICTPRKTPYAYMDTAKAKLDSDVEKGIIEKVPVGTPSRWCSAMSFVPKPGGKVRSVVDLVQLNKFVERPAHPFPAPKDIVARIPKGAKWFAVFDAANGYWQIPLEEESREYTTFMTEWGRFRYLRAPMGLVLSGDKFCTRTDRALAGVPGVHKLVDDILVYGNNHAELLQRIKMVFERCQEWGITLSKSKYQIGPVVQFAGYIVSEEGTRQNPKLVEAIAAFPAPKDLTNLRSLMGLVNRFNDCNPDLKQAMVSWQSLLKKANAFVWGDPHEAALTKVK